MSYYEPSPQCEALTGKSAYTRPHRCEIAQGTRRHGRLTLCAHHRRMADSGRVKRAAL